MQIGNTLAQVVGADTCIGKAIEYLETAIMVCDRPTNEKGDLQTLLHTLQIAKGESASIVSAERRVATEGESNESPKQSKAVMSSDHPFITGIFPGGDPMIGCG